MGSSMKKDPDKLLVRARCSDGAYITYIFLLFLPHIHPEGILSHVQVPTSLISLTVTMVPLLRIALPDGPIKE